MLLPERAPTTSELRKWDALIKQLDRAKRWLVINYMLKNNFGIIQQFCADNGLPVPEIDPSILVQLTEKASQFQTIQKAIQAVERLELGIRFKNGDIDIVAPTWYTAEQTQDYTLGLWPLIFAGLAVVLIVGLSARLITIEDTCESCEKKLKEQNKKLDAQLCQNPNDPTCQKWQKIKKETEYVRAEGTIDQIKNGLKKFGGAAIGGIGLGLAVAIPLLAWSWFKK